MNVIRVAIVLIAAGVGFYANHQYAASVKAGMLAGRVDPSTALSVSAIGAAIGAVAVIGVTAFVAWLLFRTWGETTR